LQAEHFILGLFTKAGSIRKVESKHVADWLTEESLQYLYDLGERVQPQDGDPIISNFPTEQVVAYTYLGKVQGEDCRLATWNHTILVRHRDLFLAINPKVKQLFIKGMDTPPKILNALEFAL
jgi:hypothetical protein